MLYGFSPELCRQVQFLNKYTILSDKLQVFFVEKIAFFSVFCKKSMTKASPFTANNGKAYIFTPFFCRIVIKKGSPVFCAI